MPLPPPPQLSTHRTPSPLRFFLRGLPITVPPSTTIVFSLSLYQHHRYQLRIFIPNLVVAPYDFEITLLLSLLPSRMPITPSGSITLLRLFRT